jgi:hypothetical protein
VVVTACTMDSGDTALTGDEAVRVGHGAPDPVVQNWS